ncbi:MAG: DNA mismatch repair endonuclease MutL [Bacteroidota bacterium]|nr:DNA mismatch repair endonuclease MutL [Bacteroidota bacterium]
MSDIIHLLPDSVANQIAAGEVIQRPASVLKELVENSIDAGATFIQIVIKDAGRTLIQVVDNGKGMSETDARMAFERHATSKIENADDLFSLRTMGFRGEALASIAAVAQVELRTRRSEDELGILVEIAGTRVFKQETVQCDLGTSFQVKNLFFNVPARRRFLKSDNVEKSHILTEFYRVALVNSNIAFSLFDGDEEIFQLPASNNKIRIENIFGKNVKKRWQQQLLTIETSTNIANIHGYVGKPEYAQKSGSQYFFVNGRYMRHPYFHKAVLLAYNQMIQASESPNYFIYLEVDPQTIDINIHPTKTEIKFENEQAIWSILSATVKEALGKFNVVPSIDFDQEGAVDMPTGIPIENIRPPQTNFNPNYNPFGTTNYKRPALNWEDLYGEFEKKNDPVESSATGQTNFEPPATISVDTSFGQQQEIDNIELRAENFQYKNRYILTGIKSGLLMIDQHRAHTRVLFDQFLIQIENSKGISQQVLFPEILELSVDDMLLFEQIMPDLQHVGFEFEILNNNSLKVIGVSAQVGTSSVLDLILDILENAKKTAADPTTHLKESISLSMAEYASLKAGQHLTNEEMSDLIDRLFACANHNFTPDGKKIMTLLSLDELEKRF